MTLEDSRTRPDSTAVSDRPVIAIDGLVKSFSGRVVIDHVDPKVYPGTIVTIIGQSGGGKTWPASGGPRGTNRPPSN